jgi:lethal(2) giant larvae protein
MSGGHFVLIVSEEQFKIFSLPNLKPQNKYKLTAHEGSKVRRMALVDFFSRSDENYKENDLVILTNMGDTQVFTIPNLRRQLKSQVIRKDNINGIVSALLTTNGEGFYPNSPSEFVRFSLSPRRVCRANCSVEIKDGVRPPPPEPEPEVPAATEDAPASETAAETTATDAEATQEAAVASPETPADSQEGGAASDGDKCEEQAAADGANDTIASADLTIDSIKCHISEDSSQAVTSRTVSSSLSRTVVTKRIITQSSDEGTRVVASETTTVTTSDDGGAAVSSETTVTTSETVEENPESPNREEQSLEIRETNGIEVNGSTELPELRIMEDEERATTSDKINANSTANGHPASEIVPEAIA